MRYLFNNIRQPPIVSLSLFPHQRHRNQGPLEDALQSSIGLSLNRERNRWYLRSIRAEDYNDGWALHTP